VTVKYPGEARTESCFHFEARAPLENLQLLISSPRHPVCTKKGKLPNEGAYLFLSVTIPLER